MVSLPRIPDTIFKLLSSFPPRKSMVEQHPATVSALSLYIPLSCEYVCNTICADMFLERMTLIKCSQLGIFWFANSSKRQVTWMGSLPW